MEPAGLGLEVLRLGCGVELWGHGGSLEGYQTTAFSTPNADRQLVMATNLNPEPEPEQPRRPWRTSSAERSAASTPRHSHATSEGKARSRADNHGTQGTKPPRRAKDVHPPAVRRADPLPSTVLLAGRKNRATGSAGVVLQGTQHPGGRVAHELLLLGG